MANFGSTFRSTMAESTLESSLSTSRKMLVRDRVTHNMGNMGNVGNQNSGNVGNVGNSGVGSVGVVGSAGGAGGRAAACGGGVGGGANESGGVRGTSSSSSRDTDRWSRIRRRHQMSQPQSSSQGASMNQNGNQRQIHRNGDQSTQRSDSQQSQQPQQSPQSQRQQQPGHEWQQQNYLDEEDKINWNGSRNELHRPLQSYNSQSGANPAMEQQTNKQNQLPNPQPWQSQPSIHDRNKQLQQRNNVGQHPHSHTNQYSTSHQSLPQLGSSGKSSSFQLHNQTQSNQHHNLQSNHTSSGWNNDFRSSHPPQQPQHDQRSPQPQHSSLSGQHPDRKTRNQWQEGHDSDSEPQQHKQQQFQHFQQFQQSQQFQQLHHFQQFQQPMRMTQQQEPLEMKQLNSHQRVRPPPQPQMQKKPQPQSKSQQHPKSQSQPQSQQQTKSQSQQQTNSQPQQQTKSQPQTQPQHEPQSQPQSQQQSPTNTESLRSRLRRQRQLQLQSSKRQLQQQEKQQQQEGRQQQQQQQQQQKKQLEQNSHNSQQIQSDRHHQQQQQQHQITRWNNQSLNTTVSTENYSFHSKDSFGDFGNSGDFGDFGDEFGEHSNDPFQWKKRQKNNANQASSQNKLQDHWNNVPNPSANQPQNRWSNQSLNTTSSTENYSFNFDINESKDISSDNSRRNSKHSFNDDEGKDEGGWTVGKSSFGTDNWKGNMRNNSDERRAPWERQLNKDGGETTNHSNREEEVKRFSSANIGESDSDEFQWDSDHWEVSPPSTQVSNEWDSARDAARKALRDRGAPNNNDGTYLKGDDSFGTFKRFGSSPSDSGNSGNSGNEDVSWSEPMSLLASPTSPASTDSQWAPATPFSVDTTRSHSTNSTAVSNSMSYSNSSHTNFKNRTDKFGVIETSSPDRTTVVTSNSKFGKLSDSSNKALSSLISMQSMNNNKHQMDDQPHQQQQRLLESSTPTSIKRSPSDAETQLAAARMKYMMEWKDSKTIPNAATQESSPSLSKKSPQDSSKVVTPPSKLPPRSNPTPYFSSNSVSRIQHLKQQLRRNQKECAPSFDEGNSSYVSNDSSSNEEVPMQQASKSHEARGSIKHINQWQPPRPQQPLSQKPPTPPTHAIQTSQSKMAPFISINSNSSVLSEDDSIFSNFSHLRQVRSMNSSAKKTMDQSFNHSVNTSISTIDNNISNNSIHNLSISQDLDLIDGTNSASKAKGQSSGGSNSSNQKNKVDKSDRSYSAPSFDEAASTTSSPMKNTFPPRLSPSLSSSRHPNLPTGRNIGAVNSVRPKALLWGGQLLQEKRHEESNQEGVHDITDSFDEHVSDTHKEQILEVDGYAADTSSSSKEESGLSMAKLVETALQEATWSTNKSTHSPSRAKRNHELPPPHPLKPSAAPFDHASAISISPGSEGRNNIFMTPQKHTQHDVLSPTRSDHSADAAAGAKHTFALKNRIFGHLPGGMKENQEFSNNMDIDDFHREFNADIHSSWEEGNANHIVQPTSPAVVVVTDDEGDENDNKHHENEDTHTEPQSGASGSTFDLESKLGRLNEKSTSVPSPPASVISRQLSVESECVRQNAAIALQMEGAMMDFLVQTENSDIHPKEMELDEQTISEDSIFSASSKGTSEPGAITPHTLPSNNQHQQHQQHQQRKMQQTLGHSLSGLRRMEREKRHFTSLLSVDEEEESDFSDSIGHLARPMAFGAESHQSGSTIQAGAISKSHAVHSNQYTRNIAAKKPDKHFTSLLSVDEEEEFGEPSWNKGHSKEKQTIPPSHTHQTFRQEKQNVYSKSAHQTSHAPAKGPSYNVKQPVLNMVSKNNDLAKFMDNILSGCYSARDGDNSDVFSYREENSEFNDSVSLEAGLNSQGDRGVFVVGAAVEDEENSIVDIGGVGPLPPNTTDLTAKERDRIRREDPTPIRTNTSRARRMATAPTTKSSLSGSRALSEGESCFDKSRNIVDQEKHVNDAQSEEEVQSTMADFETKKMNLILDDDVLRSYKAKQGYHISPNTSSEEQLRSEEVIEEEKNEDIIEVVADPNITQSTHQSTIFGDIEESKDQGNDCDQEEPVGAVKMTERERRKGSSLHWQSSNGVNEDEEYISKPKHPRKVKMRPTFSSIISAHLAFRDNNQIRNPLYNPEFQTDETHLGFIKEGSCEDNDSSDEEDQSNVPEYHYDDFIRDFKDIIPNEKETTLEEDPNNDKGIGYDDSSRMRSQIEMGAHQLGGSFRQNPTMLQTKFVSEEKSKLFNAAGECGSLPVEQPPNTFSFTDDHHPHYVPSSAEMTKICLEEKLNSLGGLNGKNKTCASSIGTSDLGSLVTRESEISHNVPRMIFHKTHPSAADSHTSSPSSMGDTFGTSAINQAQTQLAINQAQTQFVENGCMQHFLPQECTAEGQQVLSRVRVLVPCEGQMSALPSQDRFEPSSQNFVAAAAAMAKIEEELARTKSLRDMPKFSTPVHAANVETRPSPTVVKNISGKTSSVKNVTHSGRLPIGGKTSTRPETHHKSSRANHQNRYEPPPRQSVSTRGVKEELERIDTKKIASFWKQLDDSSEVNCAPPILKSRTSVKSQIKGADDASQTSFFEAFEIAPLSSTTSKDDLVELGLDYFAVINETSYRRKKEVSFESRRIRDIYDKPTQNAVQNSSKVKVTSTSGQSHYTRCNVIRTETTDHLGNMRTNSNSRVQSSLFLNNGGVVSSLAQKVNRRTATATLKKEVAAPSYSTKTARDRRPFQKNFKDVTRIGFRNPDLRKPPTKFSSRSEGTSNKQGVFRSDNAWIKPQRKQWL